MPDIITNPRWLVGRTLGGGGGGDVYLCFSRQLVGVMDKYARESGNVILEPRIKEASVAKFLEILYRAIALGTDGLGALKIPKLPDARSSERVKREIVAMKSCSHPALIRLLDYDEQELPKWFVIEYHPGGDLTKIVASYKAQPLKSLIAIRPLVAGVAELHQSGYVHRDIKPKNIFVGKSGELILGDFGIVFPPEEDTRVTHAGEDILSRDWVPDWIRFDDVPPQPKVDVFMLAKVMYFMVSGGGKVLASQLARPHHDLVVQFPQVPGMAAVYTFLKDYITTDEESCKAEHAGQMLEDLDALIEELKGNYQTQLIFNFVSTHSTTNVLIFTTPDPHTNYPQLNGLKVFVPRPSHKFRAFARVIPPGERFDVQVTFRIDNHRSNSITVHGQRTMDGIWSEEIALTLPAPISRGVHTLDVIPLSEAQSGQLTAFMLFAE